MLQIDTRAYASDALEDMSEPEIRVSHLPHIDTSHSYHRCLIAVDAQYAVPHDISSGVDAHYDMFGFRVSVVQGVMTVYRSR